MRKQLFTLLMLFGISTLSLAQSGTEFWLAPPEVTVDHNPPGDEPIYLNLTSFGAAATVTISQPANAGFTPIVVNLGANDSHREVLTSFKADLETSPTNTILSTGLLVESTATISAYYEVSNTNNPDIMSLKGENGLGTEFYIPLHKHAPFYNHTFTNIAYSAFDIVATEDNTTILIFSPVELDGHPALTPFTIVLNRGETYSAAWTGTNYTDPATNPAGAAVVSDKPIAISIKDDSVHNPSGGCYDFMGDQIIPVDILGEQYVAVKGFLNNTGDESAFVMATENNTKVYLNGSTTEVATLFAGQYYRVDMDSLSSSANNSILIETSRPSYVNHVTGFGCESGMALLPPMNCAGSEQVSFVRSTTENFYLNIMVRSGSENDFSISGSGTATIDPSIFQPVPGTGGIWLAGQFQFNTTEIPSGDAHLISNSSDVFTLGIINGGGSSGCRYGYFSEFVGIVEIDAGPDQTVCISQSANLAASVDGGASTGIWTTSGSGSFDPNDTDLNATYVPSVADYSLGSVTLTITSTGQCDPESDTVEITFQDEPEVDAGDDENVCSNNSDIVLDGSVVGATGGQWSGGLGTYNPDNTTLNATYTPTNAEILSGSVTLTLTSVGNGNCTAQTDNVTFTFTQAPTLDAGIDQSICENNADVDLSAAATVASGGFWSGGAGSYSPSNTFLNSTYTPTAGEIASGSITLTVTTSGNGNCLAVTDDIEITFTTAPSANAGTDATYCANNSEINLGGSVSGSTGGEWSGGLGSFDPSNSTLTGTYTPSASELTNGSVTLTLSTTGNGNCSAETDDVTFSFTPAPTVSAGSNETVCANAPDVNLNGSFTVSTGIQWSGGLGTYTPSSTSATATYSPTPGEIATGNVTLTLTTTGNGTCNPVSDSMVITYTPSPTVDAGSNLSACENNAAIDLNGSIAGAPSGIWSGGAGSFSPNNTSLDATYTPTAAEISSGSVSLTLTSSGVGTCSVESDNMTLSFTTAPTADAGLDADYCENNATVSLAGDVDLATGGQWTGGNGSFNPDATTLTTLYTPSAAELAAGSVTLTLVTTGNGNCSSVSDPITLNFTSAPTVDAGVSQTLCANNADTDLDGTLSGASGVLWTGGLGSYSPNANDPEATYTPAQSELDAGTVTLNIETTGNGNCLSVQDQVVMNFTPAPTISAGTNQSICENNADASLNGTVSIASGAVWSGGLGSFSPDNTTLNATYTPTQAEIDAGNLTLVLTSTGNGNCAAETANMDVTFTVAPSVDAGTTDSFCENNSDISLAGSFSDAGGIQWSGGLGTFVPDNATANATYSPAQTELDAGLVTLTLVSTGNGNCTAVSDPVSFNFTSAPTVDGGLSQSLCANNADADLNGSQTGATGVVWSGGLGSFSPDATDPNATYTPTQAEIDAGIVTLDIQTTGNGNCLSVQDQVIMNFTPAPTLSAGTDQSVCENNADASLNGTVSIASGALWSGGLGTFSPDNTTLNATYTPTQAEIDAGNLTLVLTSTGNGNCSAETSNMELTFTSAPSVEAGNIDVFCENNSDITLDGSFSDAGGIQWSGGLGTFVPDNQSVNAVYSPSQSELDAGLVTLTISSTGNGGCVASTDDVDFTFTDAPTADAGPDQDLCSSVTAVQLAGAYGLSTGAQWSGGAGTYLPSNTDMNAEYFPTETEKALGNLKLTLTTTGNGDCVAVEDEVELRFQAQPFVNAGSDAESCANNVAIDLNGFVGNALGGEWSGGTGSFFPSETQSNAEYTPSPAEIAAGVATLTYTTTGNGFCPAEEDEITISILPAPIVDAGTDIIVCANNPEVVLSGNVTGASGGTWSNGFGSFSPSETLLNTTYSPVQAEIDNGIMTLTLESTGNGSCLAVQDVVSITFTDAPTANAGLDFTICENTEEFDLNGAITVAGDAYWTGGFGSFTPNDSLVSTTYVPSQDDFNQGSIEFVLHTYNQGNCIAVTDTFEVDILQPAVVDAGEDLTPCVSESTVVLSGLVSGITNTGEWTTLGSGNFSPDNSNLNATYLISDADSIAGSITLVLSSTNNSFCDAVTDTVQVNILPPGLSTAGNDTTVCANNAAIQLDGQISGNASGGVWSSTGTGAFVPNENTLDATYIPSEGDAVNGSVILTLTANSCDQAIDEFELSIGVAPEAEAGADIIICSDQETVDISGIVSGASLTGEWSTNGNGTFQQAFDELDNVYEIDSLDIVNQQVELILTATNTPGCVTVSDTLVIDIFQEAIVDAGTDTTLCANNGVIDLAGVINNGSGPKWVSSGTGTFSPSDDVLNPQYIPSEADAVAGFVSLVLTSEASCNAASDVININFTPAPIVEAGDDFVVCSSNTEFVLDGSVTGITTEGIWTSSGNGAIGDNIDLNSTYSVSPDEFDAGGVTLYLTSENNANCLAVVDSVQIIYTEGIIANAGADQTVCEGSENTILNGLITNGSTTGIWSSSGTGVFDDPTNLGATYTFSSADSLAGTVVLTLESTNVGDCDVVTDDITISFGTNPTVDAGTDYEICGQDSIVALNGFISGGIGGEWSTSGSGNFGDETVMSTIYTLSPDDIVNGYIELTLTSEASGNCQPAADVTTINIDPIPVVFAGEDVVICTVDSVNLNAVVAYAPNVTWTTNGTGEFLVDSALTSVYIPSIADSLAGSIEVYATSFGTNVCDNVTDTMSIFVGGGALPDAGIDQFVCADGQNILLNGTIVGGGAVSWSTTGSGTFTPSNDELIVEYIPSSTDLLVGSVNLILETISGLGCEGGVDTTFIEFDPIPAITPMTDMSICESIDTVMVNGLIENADSIHWSTLGSGNFVLNNLTDVEYLPSEGDLTNGSVELIVEAFSETMCAAPNDTVTIFFSADLTADFVASNICAGQEAEFTDQTVVMNGNAIGWSWDFGDGQTENNQNPEHVYLDPGDYLVSLTVFNSTGCFDDAEQTITVEEGPTSDFEMDAEANVGDLVNTVDLSDDAASWAWDFGDGSSLNTNQNASHTYSQAGDYWVVLEVTNSLGCSDTTGALVRIGGDFVFPPNLPNAFSPNGDGENDQFFVRGGPFTEMHFIVYNGWGQEIFESQSPNEGWDGTHKGKDEPVGVYVYTVKATTVEGESFVKSGKVSLIR